MQEHAFEPEFAHFFVEFFVAVFLIASDRMTGVSGMDANLMRAAGQNFHLDERRQSAEELHRSELADRFFTADGDFDGALTADAQIGAQRCIDAFLAEVPLTFDEREITFFEPFTVAQTRMQHT